MREQRRPGNANPLEGPTPVKLAALQKDWARVKAFEEGAQDWREDLKEREQARSPHSTYTLNAR